jgi:hypothetical protein
MTNIIEFIKQLKELILVIVLLLVVIYLMY